MLDIVDARTGRLAERGTISDRVYQPKPFAQAEIDAATRKLVEDLPASSSP